MKKLFCFLVMVFFFFSSIPTGDADMTRQLKRGYTKAQVDALLAAYCLESAFGDAPGTGLLLDGTTLKASTVLQIYHGISPSANVQSFLGAADYAAMSLLLGRLTQGVAIATFTDPDTSPDVTNGGTSVVQLWRSAGTSTITNFDDGDDHSEFSDGDSFILLFNSAIVIDCSDNANIKGHGNNDYTGAAGEFALVTYDDTNNYWVFKPSETKSANFTTLAIPNHATNDAALTNLGEMFLDDTESAIAVHMGANGEVAGEVQISAIIHKTWSFDPDAVCDGDIDRLFLMTVGDEAPNGIIIDEWKVSFSQDPGTEADLDLCYADAFIGVADAAVIDVLDTTSGVSSEDTDASINTDGSAVANGKVMYLEFGTAYTATGEQIIFEMWYHAEED